MENLIKAGDYVIVQRQGYTKLHKIKEHGIITLGQISIELDNCIGQKYFETFQMVLKNKKAYTLEKVDQATTVLDIKREIYGMDNRNIMDDGNSQNLSKDDITRLQEESVSSTDIVEKLIENSKTFNDKTEYSQEKYLKKKEKKYFRFIQIRKPTIRLLAQMFYRQDPSKTLGMRIDDLSQLLTYTNIQSDGDYVLYDSGTSGLVTAAVMHAIGSNTKGRLIHMHPGNECQKNAFLAMQFPKEQNERCINVNLYSVLRCFYQNKNSYTEEEQPCKKMKLEESAIKKPCWQIENEKACKILLNKIDGLVIVSKEHPVNIVSALQPFLKGSRNLVVFNVIKEPLQDLYVHLKSKCDFVCIKLSNNFMRNYQVLPERTRPDMLMTNGGFILTAHKLVF